MHAPPFLLGHKNNMHQEQEYDYVLVVFHQLAGSYEPFSIKLFSFLLALGWSIVVSVIHVSQKSEVSPLSFSLKKL